VTVEEDKEQLLDASSRKYCLLIVWRWVGCDKHA